MRLNGRKGKRMFCISVLLLLIYCSAGKEHEYASLFYCVCELNHKRKRLTNLDKCLWQQRCVDVPHSTLTYGKGLFALSNFRNFSVGEHEYFCLPFYFIPFNLEDIFISFFVSPFNKIIIATKSRIMRISK